MKDGKLPSPNQDFYLLYNYFSTITYVVRIFEGKKMHNFQNLLEVSRSFHIDNNKLSNL